MYYYHQIENRLYTVNYINELLQHTNRVLTDFGLYCVFDTDSVPLEVIQEIINGATGRLGPDTGWDDQDVDALVIQDVETFGYKHPSIFNGIIDVVAEPNGSFTATFPDRVEVFGISKLPRNNKTKITRKVYKNEMLIYVYNNVYVSDYTGNLTDYFPIDIEAYNDQSN